MTWLLVLAMTVVVGAHEPFRLAFQWDSVEPIWPNEEVREEALLRKEYVPENNVMTGIKVWKGKIYVTLPRWKSGVPVTLGYISAKAENGVTAPKIAAFPTWKMQRIGRCRSFQFVQVLSSASR